MSYMVVCKEEVRDLLDFLRRPRRRPGVPAKGWSWLVRALGFTLATLFITVLLSAALYSVAKPLGIFPKLDFRHASLGFILSVCLLVPLLEEAIFRWGLRSATYTVFAGPIAITAYATRGEANILVFLVAAIAILGVCLLWLHRNGGKLSPLQFSRRYLVNYPWIFWLYAVAFALMHVKNYRVSGIAGWSAVVLFQAPQFLGAVVLGYLRLRDGLRSSILLHCLQNSAAFYIVLLVNQLGA